MCTATSLPRLISCSCSAVALLPSTSFRQLFQPLLQLQGELLVALLTHWLHVKLHKLIPMVKGQADMTLDLDTFATLISVPIQYLLALKEMVHWFSGWWMHSGTLIFSAQTMWNLKELKFCETCSFHILYFCVISNCIFIHNEEDVSCSEFSLKYNPSMLHFCVYIYP